MSSGRMQHLIHLLTRYMEWREKRRKESPVGYLTPGVGVFPILILCTLYAGYLRLKSVVLGGRRE